MKYLIYNEGTYALEIGLKGSDLKRISNDQTTARYYIFDGGGSIGQVQLYMKGGRLALFTSGKWTDGLLEKKMENPYAFSENKNYIIKLSVNNSYLSATALVSIAEEGSAGTPVLYASASNAINTANLALGSSQNNALTSTL